jgi:hypothetical protein
MNLIGLAVLRGEAWAKRELRAAGGKRSTATTTWPGSIAQARKLARNFGRPQLIELLAGIIQNRASATWQMGLER